MNFILHVGRAIYSLKWKMWKLRIIFLSLHLVWSGVFCQYSFLFTPAAQPWWLWNKNSLFPWVCKALFPVQVDFLYTWTTPPAFKDHYNFYWPSQYPILSPLSWTCTWVWNPSTHQPQAPSPLQHPKLLPASKDTCPKEKLSDLFLKIQG